MKKKRATNLTSNKKLFQDISKLIESSRQRVAQTVNSELVMLNWHIGRIVQKDVLKGKRADYGKQILQTLSAKLVEQYGRGYGPRNLASMAKFAEIFRNKKKVTALSTQLGWSHFIEFIGIEDSLKRDFYIELCRHERWSTRLLRKKIDGMMYERTAIAKKPEKLIEQELKALRETDQMTPDLVFRDPYFLDFLGLKDNHSEKDLEAAILKNLEAFLIELGRGFAFVDRQKRITIDNEDYYLDLLFYHRPLKRLVAVELKLGKFNARDKGQMELYLRWLDKYERKEGEGAPVGVILCAEKAHEHVELLELEKSGIRVSSYLTKMLPKKVLENKLHESIRLARARIKKSGDKTSHKKK